MHLTHLRKVGGSVMLAVPPALLQMLQLPPGATVGIAAQNGKLIVQPHPRPAYSLDRLLAEWKRAKPAKKEDAEWVQSPACGAELI